MLILAQPANACQMYVNFLRQKPPEPDERPSGTLVVKATLVAALTPRAASFSMDRIMALRFRVVEWSPDFANASYFDVAYSSGSCSSFNGETGYLVLRKSDAMPGFYTVDYVATSTWRRLADFQKRPERYIWRKVRMTMGVAER